MLLNTILKLTFLLLQTSLLKKGKQTNRRWSPLTPPSLGTISQVIIDILVETLPRDSYGSIPTGGVNPVFEFKQSIRHSAYLNYLYSISVSCGIVVYHALCIQYLRFRTIAKGVFLGIFHAFYPTSVRKFFQVISLSS